MKTIDRRTLGLAFGLAAAAAAINTPAKAQIGNAAQMKGPWTGGGKLVRAGGQLNYATLGPERTGKPPIVLLHKLGGWLSDWRFVAPMLAQDRQVIAFDLPGHGDSHWQGPAPYIQTLGETAALLVGALDEMGVAQVDLVGTSLGGCLAAPLAAFWPERVRRLALVSCALGDAHTLEQIASAIDGPQKAIFDANGMPLPTDPQLLVKIFGILHPEAISAEGDASRRQAGRWIQPSERGVAITDIKATLKRIEAPTLLLYGDHDKAYLKFRAGAEAALKSAQSAFVADAGAFVMQDNPPATAAILKKFLNAA